MTNLKQIAENETRAADGKVPEVAVGFWILKILATTLGETAGDMVTMSMNAGYLAGSAVFAGNDHVFADIGHRPW